MHSETMVTNTLFGKDMLFAMPAIQRPYDWGVEEAGTLLADFLDSIGRCGE